jgi:hypothetical protein
MANTLITRPPTTTYSLDNRTEAHSLNEVVAASSGPVTLMTQLQRFITQAAAIITIIIIIIIIIICPTLAKNEYI